MECGDKPQSTSGPAFLSCFGLPTINLDSCLIRNSRVCWPCEREQGQTELNVIIGSVLVADRKQPMIDGGGRHNWYARDRVLRRRAKEWKAGKSAKFLCRSVHILSGFAILYRVCCDRKQFDWWRRPLSFLSVASDDRHRRIIKSLLGLLLSGHLAKKAQFSGDLHPSYSGHSELQSATGYASRNMSAERQNWHHVLLAVN
jgi:hypothetical protein